MVVLDEARYCAQKYMKIAEWKILRFCSKLLIAIRYSLTVGSGLGIVPLVFLLLALTAYLPNLITGLRWMQLSLLDI